MDPTPATPGRTELAAPVAGGWVTVTIDTAFTPAEDVLAPQAAQAAADAVRNIDPQAIREEVTKRTRTMGSDQFALTLEVVAEMLEAT